ncbi:MAG: DUF2062 domain-containing protein [Bacteroidales bacterium]|nr:DUF2062 domain-containing protein [Bacteroidales bacterium]MBQ7998484.1 DUF2062 domain-containing protein [Bacteroidales bacterium]MBQ8035090.1 DUF2062 domain-containing protein [Bacteroidales bacterium]
MAGICVLIPTYNNAATVGKVIEESKLYCKDIFVVNDGSTDNTTAVLESIEGINVISYMPNRGKGHALQCGLNKARECGFDYCITLDADGQHYPSEIPKFIEAVGTNPGSLIIGARNLNAENMPGKNTFANKFSNFWFKVETWQTLHDTQSGFRLYPLKEIEKIKLFTGMYEFELEIIVKAAWRGIKVMNIPINVYYPPAGERVSHFKPLRDFTRISLLNTFLVLVALLWYYPKKFISSLTRENISRFIEENITDTKESNVRLAAAVGYGVFCGIIPFWGYQMIFAGVSAHFLKLNKVIAILASNISIPPMIPFIIFGSLFTGGLILGKQTIIPLSEINFETATNALLQYLIGSVIFAVAAGFVFFILAFVVFKLFRKESI